MEAWELFEIESTKYLNDNFGTQATFTRQGGADSTIPDILVESSMKGTYYIEAKHCPAQCGQFVLLPNMNTLQFDYSTKNINKINPYAEKIMQEMNKDFDAFRNAGTVGKDIVFDKDQLIFTNWITTIYKEKGVKFIITNDFKLLPIDDFPKAFYVKAKYRIKRSGSSNVSRSGNYAIEEYLKNNFSLSSICYMDNKLFVNSTEDLHNKRFIVCGIEYMLSRRGLQYEIRKLSNTFNANVIFSIQLNGYYQFLSDSDFASLL